MPEAARSPGCSASGLALVASRPGGISHCLQAGSSMHTRHESSNSATRAPKRGEYADGARGHEAEDVRGNAGPACVAADGGHRSVLAVLRGSLSRRAAPELLHTESVSRLDSALARAAAERRRVEGRPLADQPRARARLRALRRPLHVLRPRRWRDELEDWSYRWPNRIVELATNTNAMPVVVDRFRTRLEEGRITHDGDEDLHGHTGAAHRRLRSGGPGRRGCRADPRGLGLAAGGLRLMQEPKSRKKTIEIPAELSEREPLPLAMLVGAEDRDARDPSKVLPGGFVAPRGPSVRVPWPWP